MTIAMKQWTIFILNKKKSKINFKSYIIGKREKNSSVVYDTRC